MTARDIFEHFHQTNKCSEVGWLLLISLDKVGKETKSSGI